MNFGSTLTSMAPLIFALLVLGPGCSSDPSPTPDTRPPATTPTSPEVTPTASEPPTGTVNSTQTESLTPTPIEDSPTPPDPSADLDQDGIPNNEDPDIDGDLVANEDDAWPTDPQEHTDTDGDGVGDNSDPDIDGDGIPNEEDAFPYDPTESSDLDGDGVGDNSDPDQDGDGVGNEDDVFPADETEQSDLDEDGIGDNSDPDIDNDGVPNEEDPFPTDPDLSTLPFISIDSPSSLTTVGVTPLTISGRVDASARSLTVNGVSIPINSSDYTFAADVALFEGHNTIVAKVVDQRDISTNASILVSLDLTPPFIAVDSHIDGGSVGSSLIDVSGLVNDIVRGTVEADPEESSVHLTVNGISAEIANRAFIARNVPLTPGENLVHPSPTPSGEKSRVKIG